MMVVFLHWVLPVLSLILSAFAAFVTLKAFRDRKVLEQIVQGNLALVAGNLERIRFYAEYADKHARKAHDAALKCTIDHNLSVALEQALLAARDAASAKHTAMELFASVMSLQKSRFKKAFYTNYNTVLEELNREREQRESGVA